MEASASFISGRRAATFSAHQTMAPGERGEDAVVEGEGRLGDADLQEVDDGL
jgi:hypothetical protein